MTAELNPVQIQALKNWKPIPPSEVQKTVNYQLWEGFLERQVKAKQAGALPLPGSSANTVPAQGVEVRTYRVRPCKAADWANLQKLGSPIIAQAVESTKPEEQRQNVEVSGVDMLVAAYCFTRPAREVYDLIEKSGPQEVKSRAIEFGEPLDLEMVREMFECALNQVSKSFETSIQYGADGEAGGEKRFFPAAPQPPMTDSVGGGTIAVNSC